MSGITDIHFNYINELKINKKVLQSLHARKFLRTLEFSDSELVKYQDRMLGIEDRLNQYLTRS